MAVQKAGTGCGSPGEALGAFVKQARDVVKKYVEDGRDPGWPGGLAMPTLIECKQGIPGISKCRRYVRIATSVFAEAMYQAHYRFWLWSGFP